MSYLLYLASLAAIYIILAQSLNLLVGFGGMLSLCHAAFYGSGAYLMALLIVRLDVSPWMAIPLAVAGTAGIAWSTGRIALKFRDDYFVLATLSLQALIHSIIYNWNSVTGGAAGLSGIVRPELGTISLASRTAYTGFSIVVALASLVLIRFLTRSPYCRGLQASRDDAVAAAALGKDVRSIRASAFVVAASFAALAGALHAMEFRSLDPDSFSLQESVFILTALIIGGTGNTVGPLVGAMALILGQEVVRQLPDVFSPPLRQVAFGAGIVVLMFFRPQGLAGRYDFD